MDTQMTEVLTDPDEIARRRQRYREQYTAAMSEHDQRDLLSEGMLQRWWPGTAERTTDG